jgi:4'-phosphopantetheinyl transferase
MNGIRLPLTERRPLTEAPPITSSTAALEPGVLDLWWFPYEEFEERQELFAAYESLLTEDERVRHQRLRFERDKRQFLATRALVRTVLSCYEPTVSPLEWRFAIGERGKPSISEPASASGWHFNLSNTRGLVVCAVSGVHSRLGVDVERLDRSNDLLALADRYFSPMEVSELRALPSSEQPSRFFDYWTLKESYIKAHGLGLAIPLDSFSFLLGANSPRQSPSRSEAAHERQSRGELRASTDEPLGDPSDEPLSGLAPSIGIVFDARRDDDPARWSFALFDGAPRFRLAVGVETGDAQLTVRARRFIPLAMELLGEGQ